MVDTEEQLASEELQLAAELSKKALGAGGIIGGSGRQALKDLRTAELARPSATELSELEQPAAEELQMATELSKKALGGGGIIGGSGRQALKDLRTAELARPSAMKLRELEQPAAEELQMPAGLSKKALGAGGIVGGSGKPALKDLRTAELARPTATELRLEQPMELRKGAPASGGIVGGGGKPALKDLRTAEER